MPDVAAFILAGGKSSRMGQDKAFLELEGRTLLARALELARSVTDQIVIVGPRVKFQDFGPVVEDTYANRGPLAGIHAALASSSAELNLILAVDLPFLTHALLRHLMELARGSAAVVTVPRIGGGYQPLCAVYRRDFAVLATSALQQGHNKIDALFAQTSTQVVEESELERFAFNAWMFDNLNTPDDWKRAAQLL
jgi:molybdopterin-guanine dinucleotide biosynthesis protein A